MIVDSGTTLIYVPQNLASAINRLFNPPAQYDPFSGLYTVACSSIAPYFAVTISGQVFKVSAEDMIVEGNSGTCVSGVQSSLGSFSILGDAFLKNVMAVFDLGNAEMSFYPRS
jgi:hypothetical protein